MITVLQHEVNIVKNYRLLFKATFVFVPLGQCLFTFFTFLPFIKQDYHIYPQYTQWCSSSACATFLVELCNHITRQAIELESCSNPLRIQQVL